jgi:hypothetical protein
MICFLYKLWISHKLDSDGRLSGAAARHLTQCPPCRRFYRAGLTFSGRLRADACMEGWLMETPIRQRVMSVVRRRAVRAAAPIRRSAALAACLALVALGALLFFQPGPTPPPPPGGTSLLERVLPVTEAEALNVDVTQPLTDEMERLSADLRSTMKFMGNVLSVVLKPRGAPDRTWSSR